MTDRSSPSQVPRAPRFQVFTGFHTDVGRQRKKNEDALLETAVPMGYLIAVADGMGGHDYGERASASVLSTMNTYIRNNPTKDPSEVLKEAMEEANRVVFQQAEEIGGTMGATCVAGIISAGKLYMAYAGDARGYLLRGTNLYPLTRDHSFVQEIADSKGPEMADHLPENFTHIVSRSLGPQADVEIAVRPPLNLSAGDVLLLCSDGLTNMVDETLVRMTLAGATPREAAKRLVDMANEAGGQDNITVIVARIDTETSIADSHFIGLNDLREMFVRTSDGQVHPITNGILEPSTWSLQAIAIDLHNAEQGASCILSTSEMGPIMYGKQSIDIPQTTEALLQMGKGGQWTSDAKRSQPPGAKS